MRARRDEPPSAWVELGYRLRYLGPGEVLRQMAKRHRAKSPTPAAADAPPPRPKSDKPLFDGIKHYNVGPEEVFAAEACAAGEEGGLEHVVAAQAERIRDLEAQLARSRELLSEAHSLVLSLRARVARRRTTA